MDKAEMENENGNSNGNYNDDGSISEPEQLRKLFIGGLDYRTTDDGLKAHFEKWGNIVDVVVMKDPKTKRSRGFGFITYSQSYMIDNAQNARPHKIDGRTVEPKRAVPRQEIDNPNAGATVKKLFVGGLRDDHDEECLREHFKDFGNILGINIVSDKETGKKRGFAFIEFDDYDPVDKIILQKTHTIKNKALDVKKAIAKQEMDQRGGGGGGGGGRGGRGGGGRGGDRGGQGWGGGRQNGGNWGGNSFGNNGNFGGNQAGGGGGGGWNNQPTPWNNQGGNDGGWNSGGFGGGQGNAGNSWGGGGNSGGNSGGGGGSFGNDYQQSYGGGPQRNNNFGGSRPAPYSQGGFNKGGNQGGQSGGGAGGGGFGGNNYNSAGGGGPGGNMGGGGGGGNRRY